MQINIHSTQALLKELKTLISTFTLSKFSNCLFATCPPVPHEQIAESSEHSSQMISNYILSPQSMVSNHNHLITPPLFFGEVGGQYTGWHSEHKSNTQGRVCHLSVSRHLACISACIGLGLKRQHSDTRKVFACFLTHASFPN